MKLKHSPDDFRVEELSSIEPGAGRFALYRLKKRSLTTPEAVAAIARRLKLPPRNISYSGLKDRHALTVQWLAIFDGPRRNFSETNLWLDYVGQCTRPLESGDIRANRFRLVVRDLARAKVESAQQAAAELAVDGLPNYFDRQRFGSLGESGEFVARAWCAEDYVRALYLAVADDNRVDRPADAKRKALLRAEWGNWAACLAHAGRHPASRAFAHLVRQPQDPRGAMALLPVEDRRFYLAAYQSHLWNRLLAAWLAKRMPAERLIAGKVGPFEVAFVRGLDEAARAELLALRLPLPSSRMSMPAGPIGESLAAVLAAEGLWLRQLKVEKARDSFFSKGERAAAVVPADLRLEALDDERHEGRKKLVASFDLPAGSYATILLQRLLA